MLLAKQVADIITLGRASMALILAYLGLVQGADVLPLAVWIMLADWMGDILDGSIARRSRVRYTTWIGDHDLYIDMLVAAGLLIYLIGAGYVDMRLALAYVLVWGLVFWRWGIPKSLGMLAQAPIYGWFLWVAIRDASNTGWWLVAWILAAVVVTWPRFPKEVVPGFLNGMREVWRRNRKGSR